MYHPETRKHPSFPPTTPPYRCIPVGRKNEINKLRHISTTLNRRPDLIRHDNRRKVSVRAYQVKNERMKRSPWITMTKLINVRNRRPNPRGQCRKRKTPWYNTLPTHASSRNALARKARTRMNKSRLIPVAYRKLLVIPHDLPSSSMKKRKWKTSSTSFRVNRWETPQHLFNPLYALIVPRISLERQRITSSWNPRVLVGNLWSSWEVHYVVRIAPPASYNWKGTQIRTPSLLRVMDVRLLWPSLVRSVKLEAPHMMN